MFAWDKRALFGNYFDSLLSDALFWNVLFHYLTNPFLWRLVQWTSTLCSFHIYQKIYLFGTGTLERFTIVISQSAARRLAFQWWLPHSFPCTVLLNGVQGMFRGDCSNFQIEGLPVGPAQSAFSNTASSGIGDEMLVSVLQTHLWLWVFHLQE